ncbi:sugar phosphate isomerase/epimerase [Evansella sp. AB-P1]|uniref:sugar phosphate isomerase/epimerase family protein n=1 Tax=Evansella sp. AB-P1 TaxID=3037653 RepID=UPI00241FE386|nr:sugar phosphate isomerase/epimerase [Evansella sp. AB-P1]MDG5787865.1 sugar phosphate isomerase/epimerase [Evansella sp. AB-P1]
MSVGILAHLFGKLPYKQLAYEIGSEGFKHVQLAMWKAIEDYDFNKGGLLNPGLAKDIKEEFAKNGVSISVLACYLHFYDRDEQKRRENIERFKELIRYAPHLGAPIVAMEVGKPKGEVDDSDWVTLRESIEELVEEAEKWGVIVGIEPANDHLIESAAQLKQMMEEVPSSNIGVVIDPGNLLKTHNFKEQDQVIEEAFELLGDRIVAAHAKDRIILDDNELHTVRAGQGEMNYELYMKLLNQYKPQVNIIMEHAKTTEERRETKFFIENIRGQVSK